MLWRHPNISLAAKFKICIDNLLTFKQYNKTVKYLNNTIYKWRYFVNLAFV